MCILKKCCFVIDLRIGCYIIGVICLLDALNGFLMPHAAGASHWISYAAGILCLVGSILYLFFGVYKRQAWAGWLFIASLLIKVILYIVASMHHTIFLSTYIIIGALDVYFSIVVYSYIKTANDLLAEMTR